MSKVLRSMLCFVLLAPMFAFGSTTPPISYAATTATVNPGAVYQANWEGWGTSLAWWGNVIGGWSTANQNAIADLLFGSSGLQFNIARYNIGGSSPTEPGMRPGAAVDSFINASGVYDWSKDARQRAVLQAARARGVNIVEAFSNSPPWWMTYSGDASGASNCGNNLKDDQYDAFADYLAEVTKHFRDSWGTTFRTVDPLNEPSSSWWCANNQQEGAHFDTDKQELIITNLAQKLAAKGLTGSVVSAPDTSFVSETVSALNSYSSATKAAIGQINTHTYGTSDNDQINLRNVAASTNKRLWMSEIDGSAGNHDHNAIGSSLWLAGRITSDLNTMRPSAWVFWQAVEDEGAQSQGSGGNWGMIHAPFTGSTQSYAVTKKYYAMANYSKFIRPGFKLIDPGYGKSVAAFDATTNKLVIVTYNDTSSDTTINYDLSSFSSVAGPVQVYRTSGTENLAALSNLAVSSQSFSAVAVANSITTYVVSGAAYTGGPAATSINDNTTGTGTNQFEYNGAWSYGSQSGAFQNDNHWSGTTNAFFQVRFNGTQAKLYGAKDASHGIAAVSIDGGAETDVDFYATTRTDNTLLWTSPALASGAHTLKVRVSGRKNAASGGTWFNADRVDVVGASANLAANSGFEANGSGTQTPSGWSTWAGGNGQNADADYVEGTSGSGAPHGGSFKGTHWKSSAYEVGSYQTITGLANGTYTLKAWVLSSGGQIAVYMEAKDYGGANLQTPIPTAATWQQISISGINVTNGQITVGFWSYANAGNWAHFDDVEVYKQ